MKLNYFQLGNHLATPLAPIYLVSGEEWFLKQEAMREIRKAAHQSGFVERLRLLQETLEEQSLYSVLYTNSLLAEKRLIEITFRDQLPTKTIAELLTEYAQKTDTNNILVIETGKIDARAAKSTWYTAIEKAGVNVIIWPVSSEQLRHWIQSHAEKYKLQIDREALTLIIDYTEGNLVATAQIIEKIYLHTPDKLITASTIQLFFNDDSRFSIFDFANGFVEKDKVRLIKILKSLAQDRAEPTLILWSLLRELRTLAEMAQNLKNGTSFAKLCEQYRIFPRRQSQLKAFFTTTNLAACLQLLQRATEIDKFIKGSAAGNVWQMLELLILTL